MPSSVKSRPPGACANGRNRFSQGNGAYRSAGVETDAALVTSGIVTAEDGWQPRHDDPLLILAMDHRESFGRTLFGVVHDEPDAAQLSAMKQAKQLIFEGLRAALPAIERGRAGVLVDELYGQAVVDSTRNAPTVLAVPVEASGHEWFTLQYGDRWLEHVERIRPAYAKVLVRDNPDFDAARRDRQFTDLAGVAAGLRGIGVPLLYELLVPATDAQLAGVGHDTDAYDRDLRPGLVAQVISDNQAREVEPALWKVEGFETVDGARHVADQVQSGGRTTNVIVLGRDAPQQRLDHWIDIAVQVPAFVGFAIGRSIWEDPVAAYRASDRGDAAADRARAEIASRYLGFVAHWRS